MTNSTINQILNNFHNDAIREVKKNNGESVLKKLNTKQKCRLCNIISNAESFKAVVTVLTTSLIKKIENPKQDIRYHKKELKGGYSGRTLDTKFITPFFKKYFTRFAMKESGWLTRSLEQPLPFTLEFPGKIKNMNIKRAFLEILHDIETKKAKPESYILALFILLLRETHRFNTIFTETGLNFKRKTLTINLLIESLKKHFFTKYDNAGVSRLPVIAVYSIYEVILKDIARYKNRKLLPLKSHVASDVKTGEIGDIVIINPKKGTAFEGVEIKHGIAIDISVIRDVYKKIKNIPVERYYILTTSEPNIKRGEEQKVNQFLFEIKKNHGCEIVVNGLIPSLKYYLRLIYDLSEFMGNYSKNIKVEASQSTIVKIEHLKEWNEIIKKF